MSMPLLMRNQIESYKFTEYNRDILNYEIYIILNTMNYLKDKLNKRELYWLNYHLTSKTEKLCIVYSNEIMYLNNMKNKILHIKSSPGFRLNINTIPMMFTLPNGWNMKYDENEKKHYFIDHNTKKTQWMPPKELMDKYMKELSIKHKI